MRQTCLSAQTKRCSAGQRSMPAARPWPTISWEPSAATAHTDFGNVAVGGTLTRTYTIANSGSADLTLTGTGDLVVLDGAGCGRRNTLRGRVQADGYRRR